MTPELFAHICYIVLMQNGEGVLDKSPNYITEKLKVLDMGYWAYQVLDMRNKKLLLAYLDKWGYDIPEQVKEMENI